MLDSFLLFQVTWKDTYLPSMMRVPLWLTDPSFSSIMPLLLFSLKAKSKSALVKGKVNLYAVSCWEADSCRLASQELLTRFECALQSWHVCGTALFLRHGDLHLFGNNYNSAGQGVPILSHNTAGELCFTFFSSFSTKCQ